MQVFPGDSDGKESLIQSLVRKIPKRKDWLLTAVFLPGEFRGAWQTTVRGVAKSQT